MDPSVFSNGFYKLLIEETWEQVGSPVHYEKVTVETEYKAVGRSIYVTGADLALIWDPEYKAIVQAFAADESYFQSVFAKAWTGLMNADRFDGPDGSVCS